jgi:hypothetical protein
MDTPSHDMCNYIEIVFLDPSKYQERSNVSIDVIDTDVSDEFFTKCMERVKSFNYKYFQKSFKTYVSKDLYLENMGHQDIKVYGKTIISVDNTVPGKVTLSCHKEKKPYHAFPSTTTLHAVYYTNRLTFRINNRLYINFDVVQHTETKDSMKRVFVNYNHDVNVDMEHITGSLENVMKTLLQHT